MILKSLTWFSISSNTWGFTKTITELNFAMNIHGVRRNIRNWTKIVSNHFNTFLSKKEIYFLKIICGFLHASWVLGRCFKKSGDEIEEKMLNPPCTWGGWCWGWWAAWWSSRRAGRWRGARCGSERPLGFRGRRFLAVLLSPRTLYTISEDCVSVSRIILFAIALTRLAWFLSILSVSSASPSSLNVTMTRATKMLTKKNGKTTK